MTDYTSQSRFSFHVFDGGVNMNVGGSVVVIEDVEGGRGPGG